MEAALATIWICVALGAALGALQRLGARLASSIRTFAVISAALVAAFSLLPHAIQSEGVWGAAAAALGFLAIPASERAVRTMFRGLPSTAVRLEIGYVGLLVHRFGDGVAMRVEGHGADVLLSLGAHEIPIVALVMLAHATTSVLPALVRVALLGAASTLGCFAVELVPGSFHSLHGYVDAVAAGILLHIVAHELTESLPHPSERGLDALAAAAAVVLWWAPGGEEGSAGLGLGVLDGLLTVAPAWSLGLVISGVLAACADGPGAAPLPLQRLVLPRREWRPESAALSVQLLGFSMTLLRVAGAGLFSAAAHAIDPGRERAAAAAQIAEEDTRPRPGAAPASFLERLLAGIERSLVELWTWLLLGVISAAYVEVLIPAGTFGATGSAWPELGAVLGLAISAHLCPAMAAPITLAFMDKGLTPDSALFGLWLGAFTNSAVLARRKSSQGRAYWVLAAVLALLGWLGAGLLSGLLPHLSSESRPRPGAFVEWGCLGVLAVFTLGGVWRRGIRRWLAQGIDPGAIPERHPSAQKHACRASSAHA